MINPVIVTDEKRVMPAYFSPEAEELPMFAENRVHQRSSGNPYPCRVVMRVDRSEKKERPFRVIALENEYLRVELMPELGGRIYSALDKRTGYDFFYKQHVVKPALIGLLGSWVSGGCEFNWPCHHRPSTYMPVDVHIEREETGAITVWMSENEPLNRLKGMVGVRLAPGEARFDTRMKVYNGTSMRRSFLWWENAAVPVNEQYRLVFPPDVKYVQFHYRKNVTEYPVASGLYNGIRMGDGVDISYHKNTRQPTSYFCAATKYDFFGGYDEGKRCGVVHVADRTVSVGKKMFTWAYNQLSRSWERALTDTDGAYAELMASSYSLNQPDFTWLMPYESKDFSQMWYPIGAAGAPLCACKEVSVSAENGVISVQATVALKGARLIVNGKETSFDADPSHDFSMPFADEIVDLRLVSTQNKTLLAYDKPALHAEKMPATIPDNPPLSAMKTAQEAYLMGVHVEQYRDPAARPDAYFKEALRRDPDFAPALTALAREEFKGFRYQEAYALAQAAWRVVTVRNFHPESGELQYLTGQILEALGRDNEAWEWYMQAAWAQDARSRAMTRAAMLEGKRGDYDAMLTHAREALAQHAGNETAMALEVIALRRLDEKQAETALRKALDFDPLNLTFRALQYGAAAALYQTMASDMRQSALDIAQELSDCGEGVLTTEILKNLPQKCAQTEYVRWYLSGDDGALDAARKMDVGIAYPLRALERNALCAAVQKRPEDANALNLLGCVEYAAGNYSAADALFARAIREDADAYMPLRNLAVSRYSHFGRRGDALPLLDGALALRPHDAELVFERAWLMTRLGVDPNETAEFLMREDCAREDTTLELCRALNMAGRHEEALNILTGRRFTPCEGGEHAVAEQFMFAHHALGRALYKKGDYEAALAHFRAAQDMPDTLGAGLWNEVLRVPHQAYEALCLSKLGDAEGAKALCDHILLLTPDYFANQNLPELPCWQALILRETGRAPRAQELIAAHLRAQEAALSVRDAGYYKTTPFFISYMEDAKTLREAACAWQTAMALWAAGERDAAQKEAARSLKGEPSNLYAALMAKGL